METEDLLLEAIERIAKWEDSERVRYTLGSEEYFKRIMELRRFLFSEGFPCGFEEDFIDRWNYETYQEKDLEKLKVIKQELLTLTYRVYDERLKIFHSPQTRQDILKFFKKSFRITSLISQHLNQRVKTGTD